MLSAIFDLQALVRKSFPVLSSLRPYALHLFFFILLVFFNVIVPSFLSVCHLFSL